MRRGDSEEGGDGTGDEREGRRRGNVSMIVCVCVHANIFCAYSSV